MVGDACVAGAPEALDACLADGDSASFVFVVGGDVADALMKPYRVVVVTDAFQLSLQYCGVIDRFEVWPLVFDVAGECLDPRLIGRCVGPSMMDLCLRKPRRSAWN